MKLTFKIISSSVYLEIKRKQCLPAITTETSLQKYNINSSREGKGIKQNIRITLIVDMYNNRTYSMFYSVAPVDTFPSLTCLSLYVEMSRPPPEETVLSKTDCLREETNLVIDPLRSEWPNH